MKAISERLGMTAETLRKWVRQAEVDAGEGTRVPTETARELRELRRKCRELNVPVVFCENRRLAEEWTYRFLAAARAWASTEHAALHVISTKVGRWVAGRPRGWRIDGGNGGGSVACPTRVGCGRPGRWMRWRSGATG
jgi:hypothetical protein